MACGDFFVRDCVGATHLKGVGHPGGAGTTTF
jgi:hypothetical protein